jgi:hypothetical protein
MQTIVERCNVTIFHESCDDLYKYYSNVVIVISSHSTGKWILVLNEFTELLTNGRRFLCWSNRILRLINNKYIVFGQWHVLYTNATCSLSLMFIRSGWSVVWTDLVIPLPAYVNWPVHVAPMLTTISQYVYKAYCSTFCWSCWTWILRTQRKFLRSG